MRAGLLIVAAGLLGLAGCGDDTTSTTGMNDFAVVSDMAVAADLTNLSCNAILSCVAGCGQNLVCQQSCRDAGTTAAKGFYDAFTGCVALTCGPADGGMGPCTSATDTSSACETCLANVATQAPGASSPCHTEYAICAGS